MVALIITASTKGWVRVTTVLQGVLDGLTHCDGDTAVFNGPSISTALHRAASKIHVY